MRRRHGMEKKGKLQTNWAELLCFRCTCLQLWAKAVLRKWLNICSVDSDFSADEGETTESEFECDGCHMNDTPYKWRRRKSETPRAQYIDSKELRICAGTWNVGGKLPPDDLEIKDWLGMAEPADIYVLGLQEIVPLNAVNILGAEDRSPVQRWEYLIRRTLSTIRPTKLKYNCFSDPPSPLRFKPSDDTLGMEDALLRASDSETDEDISPLVDDSLEIDNAYIYTAENQTLQQMNKKRLTKTLSCSERIGLVWPEHPLDIFAQLSLDGSNTPKSFKSSRKPNSFKAVNQHFKDCAGSGLLSGLNVKRKKRSSFVRIISKQMVGIYLSIWVRRSLRKHVQNLKVSSVGVGVMGYIGNKGSISISLSIFQTLFCFVCCHLTSGEKEGDKLRRNADVQEIHRRTLFRSTSTITLPKTIFDHERIIWLGDLNYRMDLSYGATCELISRKEWSTLIEGDQLKKELKKGRAFDGWSEGIINFPPTYKYELNSERYIGDDPKVGRRTPAWCDRILSFGKGMRLIDYQRSEIKLSDHRPVKAIFVVDVEVLCPRKLKRALAFTDAEIEEGDHLSDEEMML